VTGITRKKAVAYLSATYGWDPRRVDRAILKIADHSGRTSEVYYRDPTDYHSVTVVHIVRTKSDRYEISEENRPARLAATPRVRYSKRVPNDKGAVRFPDKQEAITVATATKRGRAKAEKAPEPELVEDEIEELEDEVEEDEVEELEDEVEEVEEDEEDEEDEDEDEDEDEEPEPEVTKASAKKSGKSKNSETQEAEEPKDYTVYASKAITSTMEDFAEWLSIEVCPLEELEPDRIVSLAGTLRMEFQKSQFCRDRREERKAASAKAAPKPKKEAADDQEKPAVTKSSKTAAPAKTASKTTAPAKTASKTTARTVPGRPAPRAADRPAAAKKTSGRRTAKPAEAPF
jgi:hypothetical protein